MIKAIGSPDDKYELGSETVFIWSRTVSKKRYVTVSNPGFGEAGFDAVRTSHTCKLKIVTDHEQIIRSWSYQGDADGCASYVKEMNEYVY